MQLIATIEDPAVMRGILAHLGLPCTPDGPQPPFSMTDGGVEQRHSPASPSRRCRGPRQPRTSVLPLPGALVAALAPCVEAQM